jgi:hypothetical protein
LIEFSEITVRQWSSPQLKQDLAPPGSKTEAECFGEVAMSTVLIDELAHERPSLLGRAR